MTRKVGVGVVGCDHVSLQYLEGFETMSSLEVVGCFDVERAQAQTRAAEFDIPYTYDHLEELLADPAVEIVLNITPPLVHFEVSEAALAAGKHVFSEKPLAPTREQGQHLLHLAAANGVRLACAPDTFLGSGLQTSRKLLDDGWIGTPVGGSAFFLSNGVEHFHPSPTFFYGPAGGPVLDVGPYFLTALINLLGPVARVTAISRISFPERMITSPDRYGSLIKVETPTYVSSVLEFESGIITPLLATFDVQATRLPFIEVYGTEGSLSTTDPDLWSGSPEIRRYGEEEKAMLDLERNVQWTAFRSSRPLAGMRGVGVHDLAQAIIDGRPHRVAAEVAYHVLDIALSIAEAAEAGVHVEVASTCTRPAPLQSDVVPIQPP